MDWWGWLVGLVGTEVGTAGGTVVGRKWDRMGTAGWTSYMAGGSGIYIGHVIGVLFRVTAARWRL